MEVFSDTINIKDKKIYQIQALYNTDTTLEFVIQPDGDHILPSEIYLNFSVEIEENYLPDNQADKYFDSVDVIINNEKIIQINLCQCQHRENNTENSMSKPTQRKNT